MVCRLPSNNIYRISGKLRILCWIIISAITNSNLPLFFFLLLFSNADNRNNLAKCIVYIIMYSLASIARYLSVDFYAVKMIIILCYIPNAPRWFEHCTSVSTDDSFANDDNSKYENTIVIVMYFLCVKRTLL